MIRLLDKRGKQACGVVKALNRPSQLRQDKERQSVCAILSDIERAGDGALLKYTNKFEGTKFIGIEDILVGDAEIKRAYDSIPQKLLGTMKRAIKNIERYHKKQLQNSWVSFEEENVMLGQRITPISRVGIYVPGGRACYPSSVLMNAIPAKIAGVDELIMVTPPTKDGKINPAVLVAAHLTGVDKVYKIGGAQAVGALAYGTESIPKVDKIVGPGNIYVTLAKREVFGIVDIDMIAGPSEILIIADESASPAFIAADLLSQAEHDPMASSILVTDSLELATKVKKELKDQLIDIGTKDTIEKSLSRCGYLIVVDDIETAAKVANELAPEHLEIMTMSPERDLHMIKNAGSIFLGPYSPEPLGDYMAGPNHVLPTSGTAKFYSPLGVDDFIKRSSIIQYSKEAFFGVYKDVARLARAEGFEAHARSAEVRFEKV